MAHLTDRFRDEVIMGYDEAMANERALIRKNRERQDRAEEAILDGFTRLSRRIAALEKAAVARPSIAPSKGIPPDVEGLAEKLRAASIAASRSRG